MKKLRLPIGIQTFREIREGGHYYVDKTAYAGRLADEGKHYFLSRPRRFGKSLFLDTLKELFEGNERLFRGLAVHGRWDWSKRWPVVRLSFGGGNYIGRQALETRIQEKLAVAERQTETPARDGTAAGRFAGLLEALHQETGRRVVVLVDEYDKPILDALHEPGVARANRDFLRGFYGVVKDSDAHVRFSFFTGVSKFTKVSLFSELNNLIDITLESPFSSICGYTEADLDEVFAPELSGLDRDRIRDWYNGYNWLGSERVYNPFGLLLLFRTRRFDAHWFETATPSFLVDVLRRREIFTPSLEAMFGTSDLLSSFDVGKMAPEALLFQTGYLTITGEDRRGGRPRFRLGYPNREVRQALNDYLLHWMAPTTIERMHREKDLGDLLAAGDLAGVETVTRALFASIPHDWHRKNELARYEGCYASVFYSYCAGSGLDLVAEDATHRGRLDLAVRLREAVFLIEFKVVDQPTGSAIAQLRARGYADKYRASGKAVHLIGVEFSRTERNIVAFDVEPA